MNKEFLEERLAFYRNKLFLTTDYVEGKILEAQIELLEIMLESLQ